MQLKIRYETLLKRAAGVARQSIDVAETQDVRDIVGELASQANNKVRSMLVDAAGNMQPSLLIFANDCQVNASDSCPLSDGDEITLMSPISGG